MKKILLIFFLATCFAASAQKNNFVYLRYDLSHGSAMVVVEAIDQIVNRTQGQCVIYYSNGQGSRICKDKEDWEELRSTILTQQTSPDYFADEDLDRLNVLFDQCFKETVSHRTLQLTGQDDDNWQCTFILSSQMLADDSESDMMVRLFSINQLLDRMIPAVLSYDEDGIKRISYSQLKHSRLFKYFDK